MKSFPSSVDVIRKALLTGLVAMVMHPAAAQNVNEDAAEALAKAGKCFKCHSLDRAKKAPSFKRIAAKYAGKGNAEALLTKHLSGSTTVKVEDGGDEEHEPPPAKDAADMRNLVKWILSRG